MRIVVLHPYTKFEVRRPWNLEDMAHDVCQLLAAGSRIINGPGDPDL